MMRLERKLTHARLPDSLRRSRKGYSDSGRENDWLILVWDFIVHDWTGAILLYMRLISLALATPSNVASLPAKYGPAPKDMEISSDTMCFFRVDRINEGISRAYSVREAYGQVYEVVRAFEPG